MTRELAAELQPPSPEERARIKSHVARSVDPAEDLDVRMAQALRACDLIDETNFLTWVELLRRQNVALRARVEEIAAKVVGRARTALGRGKRVGNRRTSGGGA